MNLRVLRKSRKHHKPGDIFAYSPKKGVYYWGRIMRTNAQWAIGGGEVLLCYAFRAKSDSLDKIPELNEKKLLVDPFLINKLPWSRGYFVTMAHKPLTPEEQARPHYFQKSDSTFRDEYYNPVKKKPAKWYEQGLSSYAYFSYEISKKLGLPLERDAG